MEIKDYLHLYIGCEIKLTGRNTGNYKNEIVKLIGVSHTYNKTEAILSGGSWEKYMMYSAFYSEDITLILRHLSDMTESELKELVNQPDFTDHYCKKKLMEISTSIYGLYNFISFYGSHNSIRWLLSKGFDLFQLIDSGLAIDKTKV